MKTRIHELRRQRKISQEELAAAVGVTRQTITSLECEKYTASLVLAYKIGNRQKIPTFTKSHPCSKIGSRKNKGKDEGVNGSMGKGDRKFQEQRKKSACMVFGKGDKTQYTEILA